MHIFWRLILAHLLTDFTLQTDYIASWKRMNTLGGMVHSFIFFVCGAALCYPHLNEAWPIFGLGISLKGWVSLLVLTLLHFLEDEWRVWSIRKIPRLDSFLFFLWDQFIHLLLIFIFSPFGGAIVPEKWVFLGIIFILTTHFASIFIYFLEKDILGDARALSEGRYYTMTERVITCLILLLPGAWAYGLLAAWLGRVFFHRWRRDHDFPWVNIVGGNTLAILLGLVARTMYYS